MRGRAITDLSKRSSGPTSIPGTLLDVAECRRILRSRMATLVKYSLRVQCGWEERRRHKFGADGSGSATTAALTKPFSIIAVDADGCSEKSRTPLCTHGVEYRLSIA